MKKIWTLITMIPTLLMLIDRIEKNIRKGKEDRLVKEDVKKIGEAFEKRDPDMLRDIFNS